MRLDPDEEVKESGDAKDDKRGKGKLWKDESKWLHDKFDTYDQAPKSRQELIAMYGYDITQYDEPPEEAPKMRGRGRRGGGGSNRDRKPQFQDFLPDSGKDRRNYSNRESYDNDYDRSPSGSKSESGFNRGGFRGGRRARGRSDGGQTRSNYSDFKDERSPRGRGYSNRGGRDFRGQDQDDYGNRDNNRGPDNYGDRDRGNFGNRDRRSHGNDDSFDQRDQSFGNNRGNRGQFENQDTSPKNTDYNGRPSPRGGFRGGRGRGRGEPRDNRRDNRQDVRDNQRDIRDVRRDNRDSRDNFNRDNRDNVNQQTERRPANYDRQFSDNREHDNYERQNSGGGRNRQNYERQSSGGRDGESQFRKQPDNRSRPEPESPQQDFSSNRYSGNDNQTRAPPTRSYNKPTPKSYYTLSVTDDDKTGDVDDGDYSPPAKGGISDINVTVTGDRRSFNKDRQQRQQVGGVDDRREPASPHGPVAAAKHQPTLPPRLQQQQQQQERKRQKQQLQQQQQGGVPVADKQDMGQGRSNKRYSSQRQRAMPEGPVFTEPPISQPPTQQIATSQIQQQYQPNFSPTKPGSVQQAVMVRPAISQQMSTPPRQPSVGSPTMVIPGVPPPQGMIPVPGQVAQARPQRPPPGGPQPIPAPAVFAAGTLPSTVMPAVSVIGAPAMINPAGMIYAAPPPAFQVPVPQFTAVTAAPPPQVQAQNPGETVRGGTTYYSSGTGAPAPTPGTTYYSPEMQMSKQNRVQVRRPKVPLPIVNPEDIEKKSGAESTGRENEEEGVEYVDESSEQIEIETENIKPDMDSAENIDSAERVEDEVQPVIDETNTEPNTENADTEQIDDNGAAAASSEVKIESNTESVSENSEVVETETPAPVVSHNAENVSENVSDNASPENINTENYSASANDSQTNEAKSPPSDTENDGNSEPSAVNDDQELPVSEDKSESADRPTELDIVVNQADKTDSEQSTEQNEGDENRSSTFVVKTEVLTPTLSVSTSIKPESPEEKENSATEDDSSAIETESKSETVEESKTNVANDNVQSEESSNNPEKMEKEDKEENDSFEDAVETVG